MAAIRNKITYNGFRERIKIVKFLFFFSTTLPYLGCRVMMTARYLILSPSIAKSFLWYRMIDRPTQVYDNNNNMFALSRSHRFFFYIPNGEEDRPPCPRALVSPMFFLFSFYLLAAGIKKKKKYTHTHTTHEAVKTRGKVSFHASTFFYR